MDSNRHSGVVIWRFDEVARVFDCNLLYQKDKQDSIVATAFRNVIFTPGNHRGTGIIQG